MDKRKFEKLRARTPDPVSQQISFTLTTDKAPKN